LASPPVIKSSPQNRCFVCGPANPHGLQLVFQYDPEKVSAKCKMKLPARYQGATGYAHGGIIATLLDEAMAKTNGMGGLRAVTIRLEVRYRKLVPVEEELLVTGRRTSRRGRKLYLRAELQDRRKNLLAEATGLFLTV
jgi:acyl-coenzyme A thioesterase PaaI-like protein